MGGKSAKKKRGQARFNPLARPSDMAVDDDATAEAPKKLSAHQERHLERKRLQAEKASLKSQKKKVSKADKIAWKSETKMISAQLQLNRAQLKMAERSSSSFQRHRAAEAASSAAAAAAEDAGATSGPALFGGFNLPAPRPVESEINWS